MPSECIDHGCKGYGMGYATAWIKLPSGERKPTTKHRKVYYEATGELPEVVRHTCDNPRCINIKHLVAGTQVDNMRDMAVRGRAGDCRNFGDDNGRTVVGIDTVKEIRSTYRKGCKVYGLPALSRKYGISTSQVWRIVKGVHHATTT